MIPIVVAVVSTLFSGLFQFATAFLSLATVLTVFLLIALQVALGFVNTLLAFIVTVAGLQKSRARDQECTGQNN
ncbi:MAG: hypothetical protein ACXVZV_12770 [Terriglobales bacterium]